MWSIRDAEEPACPRHDCAGSTFVFSVVHREVGVDAGEVSLLTVHSFMLQVVKTAVAYAFPR